MSKEEKSFIIKYYSNKCGDIRMTRSDNVLNMQITIANTMKQEWNIDFEKVSDILEKYDLLPYIDSCYEEYNSMGIKGILLDLESYIAAMEEAIQ